mgnify:CR=1 FL=1
MEFTITKQEIINKPFLVSSEYAFASLMEEAICEMGVEFERLRFSPAIFFEQFSSIETTEFLGDITINFLFK